MALINYNECENKVSELAESCPKGSLYIKNEILNMFRLLYFFTLILLYSNVQSTPACNAPSRDWFLLNVVGKTNNVVYAEISPKNDSKNKKNVKILKNIYSEDKREKFVIGTTVVVNNWTAYDNVQSISTSPQNVILFLSAEDDGYELSNDNWKSCRPSIIYKHPVNDKFLIPFREKERTIEQNIIEIEKTIRELFKDRSSSSAVDLKMCTQEAKQCDDGSYRGNQ